MLQFGEAHDYHLNIQAPVSFITTGQISLNSVCAGQAVSVNFTTNLSNGTYQAQLSDATGNNFTPIGSVGTSSPLTVTIPANTPTGNGHKIRMVSINPSVTGSASNAFGITTIPSAPSVMSTINYTQNQTATALTATGSNLKWYTAASGGTGSNIAPIPQTASIGTTFRYVSQTMNNCESTRAAIQINVNAPATASVCFNVKVFLEGALSAGTMTKTLNQQGQVLKPFHTKRQPRLPFVFFNGSGNYLLSQKNLFLSCNTL